jgi:predicted flavoprotein YhiN
MQDARASEPNRRGPEERPRVIVIGGGAAGLLAAGAAAAAGAETLVLEKMERPGRKLRITGKGRCNLTNIAPLPDFIAHFGRQGDFLRQAFARFFSDDLIALLRDLGVPTVTERGGRVFPSSEAAEDVVGSLVRWATEQGAVIRTRARVVALGVGEKRITVTVARTPGLGRAKKAGRAAAQGSPAADEALLQQIPADAVVLATGGASYPGTGSTGDGYRLAAEAGHAIVPVRPALVPLETAGPVARRLQGLSLRNASVRLLVGGRRSAEEFGEMLFTHFGVSGPAVLTLSGRAVDALRAGASVAIAIDLKPALAEGQLDERLLRDLAAHKRRRVAALLAGLLPRKLIPVCAELTGISIERPCHQVTAAERRRLRMWLKDFRLEVTAHRPLEEAIITAGGVDLREVNPRTLASRKVRGLYICGELLDIDADTGGYNLQAAFSTGWLAGQAASGAKRAGEIVFSRPAL